MFLNEEDDIFVTPAQAGKLRKSTNRGQSQVRSSAATLHLDLFGMCKCVAEKLEVHWLVVIEESTQAHSWRRVQ